MKIFSTKQIAEIDQLTINREPIAAVDLMERASIQVANWLAHQISNEKKLVFFAGPGNNGGDALAIARMMAELDYKCEVYLLNFGKDLQGASAINWMRLIDQRKVQLSVIENETDLPIVRPCDVVLDGLFGSGLSRVLVGLPAAVVELVNSSGATVIAIDIPSGLFGEDNSKNDCSMVVCADYTLTFQFPKLSFFFPEHENLLGNWKVLPIGLNPAAIHEMKTPYRFLEDAFIASKLIVRNKFSHKGTFGHALLIAGSYGKVGAAVLASKACLRVGAGLLTTHVPHTGYPIIQNAVPEAMCSIDPSDLMFTEFPALEQFTAVGVGPGLGQKTNSQKGLRELLLAKPAKLVIDADALNILSANKEWLELLPENTVLTPHPKEFERLVGVTTDSWTRLQLQLQFSKQYKVIVVLKGAHTCITNPDGQVFFNTTGNQGMATAGSGDVLTGIILGLLAQDYNPLDAALLGVYIHGLSGDWFVAENSQEALIASDLTDGLKKVFRQLHNKN